MAKRKKLPASVGVVAMVGGLAIQYQVLRQIGGLAPKKAVYVMGIGFVISMVYSFALAATVLASDETGPSGVDVDKLLAEKSNKPAGEISSVDFGAYA